MINSEVARIFNEIADILDIKGVAWKPQAYRKAARTIQSMSKDLKVIYQEDGLKALDALPSIGAGLSKKIEEFIKTGRIKGYEKLKKTIPEGVEKFMHIPGMGPKKIKKIYTELKIKSIKELKQAIKKGKISKLEGFGKKSEQDILKGLGLAPTAKTRKPLQDVLPVAKNIVKHLKKLKSVKKIELAGSIRRMKETVRDIDILVASSQPKKVMDVFVSMPNVKRVLAKGMTKSSIFLNEGYGCDLRVVDEKSFGAALMYFTGSKDHNIRCRQIAMKKGLKLSEYGLFKGKRLIASKTEKEIYNKLGMQYIEPELRNSRHEIFAAIEKKKRRKTS
jgi:DNA polymerase (family 10)